jgi:membrane-bound lytic murein transglycosylase F
LIKKSTYFFTVLATVVIVLSWLFCNQKNFIHQVSSDLDSIRERGKLVAITDFNSTDYFIYKGEPMGFNYELLKSFTSHIGIDLEIITENNPEKAFEMLRSGSADVVAIGNTSGSLMMEGVRFSEAVDQTRQVLIKRKPGKNAGKNTEAKRNVLRDKLGLGKNVIYVQTGYTDIESLASLASSMGDTIYVSDVPYEQEKLISYVANGLIDYTVCDENIALVNATYYPGIDVTIPASDIQEIAWGVRKNNSDSLLTVLNGWIKGYKKTLSYALLYAKYFKNSRSGIIIKSDYYAINTGKISRYDELIKKYSATINWDWRLLASLICQESRFDPSVESGAGAYGLMQVMPETGEKMGIDITASPENNMKAGIRYLDFLHSIFERKIPYEEERINFILASYNAGPGHVLDAMKLAEKNGMDPYRWKDNVEVWLLKKSQPQYYNDSVVKSGKFRGTESVAFVAEVLDRYEHYKNVIPD